jgi:putative heme iron utilization protein
MVGAMDVAQATLDQFHSDFQSLVLATVNEKNEPYTSYAPFVHFKGDYYIMISSSAPHYDYISLNNHASILLVEDESIATNAFFRKRLSYYTHFTRVDQEEIKKEFVNKFGNMAEIVLNMNFFIYKCDLEYGKLILGPGQAFFVNAKQKISSHDKSGHHSKK